MNLTLRPGTPADAKTCGEICFEAFTAIAKHHNFPPNLPNPDIAIELLSKQFSHPNYYSVVAELDGRVAGSNFLDERSAIVSVGPVSVDPSEQNRSIGRQLMQHVVDRIIEQRFPGARLVTEAYHGRSFSLYAKLGFGAREPLAVMQGPPITKEIAGFSVRRATQDDLDACNQLSRKVHGHDRGGELLDAIREGIATVVEHDSRISGYATLIAFFGHAVGETNEDLKALIGSAAEFLGPGFILPIRNADLFRWCLTQGLRVVFLSVLMSYGLYNKPESAFLPSVQ
ncbi:MAG: GNAT family N-acetyltransferase [Desulfobacterales bacterium]|nr:GNAT family N-acetyltransferase [Desulfobacterales bacterium]